LPSKELLVCPFLQEQEWKHYNSCPSSNLLPLTRLNHGDNPSNYVKKVMDEFKEYFNNEGKVTGQWDIACNFYFYISKTIFKATPSNCFICPPPPHEVDKVVKVRGCQIV